MSDDRFALFETSPHRSLAPGTVAEAQEAVRGVSGQAIIPWGGGTRRHVGHPPVRYDIALSTERLNTVIEYMPADLTVTSQAGVTLAALQETLAAHGQWLPLDVACPEKQTIGGLVAARAHSLRRFTFGSIRDALIGVKVVNGAGEIVVGGGKVVKNVAGYDLPKLYCGSWGTLGLIVEATFKVAPRPAASAVAVLPLPAERNAEDVLDRLLLSELEPSFLFLLNPAAAQTVLPSAESAQYLVIGFDGDTDAVAWQAETLGAALLGTEEAEAVRARLRDFPLTDAPMTAVFHILSSQVGAFVRMVEWTARRAGFTAHVSADAAVGILHAHFFPSGPEADWAVFYADFEDKAARVGGSRVIERMPDVLRALDAPVWSPLLPDFAMMTGIKKMLDPERRWSPGRFVGGL